MNKTPDKYRLKKKGSFIILITCSSLPTKGISYLAYFNARKNLIPGVGFPKQKCEPMKSYWEFFKYLYSDLKKTVFIHFLKQYLGSGPTSPTARIKFLLSTGRTHRSPCKTWTNLAHCSLLQGGWWCCDVDLESLKIWTFLLLMADSHRSTGYPLI